jgi:Tat protein translocase TatC
MARFGAVRHEDQLSLVDHLDELRTRLIVSVAVLAVALALCFWQNHLLLAIANAPLPHGFKPITFGVTEPFTATFTVAAYGAIILSLPILLYQLYAFILPAFAHQERRLILPLLLMVPILFVAGVVFAYFVVIPPRPNSFSASTKANSTSRSEPATTTASSPRLCSRSGSSSRSRWRFSGSLGSGSSPRAS